MVQRADSRGPVARLALAAGILLALLGIVAVASRSGLGDGAHRPPRADHALLDRLFTAFIVLLLLYVPIAASIYWSQRRYLKSELVKRRRSHGRNLLFLAVFLLSSALLVRFRTHLDQLRRLPGMRAAPASPHAAPGSRAPRVPYEPRLDWPVALILGCIALAMLAAFFVATKRHRNQPAQAEPDVAKRLAIALAESLDALYAERDPRRAVVAAYARMERALGAAGAPRVAHEVPFEYVGRALLALDVSESAARRLTALFERAKFSAHTIDETMRNEAIAALVAVREELEAKAAA